MKIYVHARALSIYKDGAIQLMSPTRSHANLYKIQGLTKYQPNYQITLTLILQAGLKDISEITQGVQNINPIKSSQSHFYGPRVYWFEIGVFYFFILFVCLNFNPTVNNVWKSFKFVLVNLWDRICEGRKLGIGGSNGYKNKANHMVFMCCQFSLELFVKMKSSLLDIRVK